MKQDKREIQRFGKKSDQVRLIGNRCWKEKKSKKPEIGLNVEDFPFYFFLFRKKIKRKKNFFGFYSFSTIKISKD